MTGPIVSAVAPVVRRDGVRVAGTFMRVLGGDEFADAMARGWDLDDGHPLVGAFHCASCGCRFAAGDCVMLLPLGPGADAERRRRCREARWYASPALVCHYACLHGEDPVPPTVEGGPA